MKVIAALDAEGNPLKTRKSWPVLKKDSNKDKLTKRDLEGIAALDAEDHPVPVIDPIYQPEQFNSNGCTSTSTTPVHLQLDREKLIKSNRDDLFKSLKSYEFNDLIYLFHDQTDFDKYTNPETNKDIVLKIQKLHGYVSLEKNIKLIIKKCSTNCTLNIDELEELLYFFKCLSYNFLFLSQFFYNG